MSEPEEIQEVLDRLSLLTPGEFDAPQSPDIALSLFNRNATRLLERNMLVLRSKQIMSNRRLVAAGLMMVLAVALLMAFPSVRAATGEFLGLFRVQKFAPISVSPEQMALLSQLGEQGMSPGEFVVEKEENGPVSVDSLQTAAAQTGYEPRVLPNRDLPSEVFVMDDASGYLIIDLAGARAILEAAEVDPMLLPDSLDGERVDVHVYPAIQELYSDGLMLMQTASPDVVYPTDVDPTLLGEALLRVLGSDPNAAHQMAQSIDWTSTLLLPIPQEMGTYREVTVDGVSGVAFEPFSSDSDPAVVWQKDGMVYMMTGPVFVDDLITQANRLQY